MNVTERRILLLECFRLFCSLCKVFAVICVTRNLKFSLTAVRIIHVGSSVTELQSIAVTIFQLYLYRGSVDS